MKKDKLKTRGTIVLGTVRGDIHDIGKNIFRMLAEAEGFEVIDLGVDVEASKFAQNIKESAADIVAISALLTTTMGEMRKIVDKIIETSLRGQVKILIGGNPISKEFAKEIGADEAGLNAVEGIEICKRWIS